MAALLQNQINGLYYTYAEISLEKSQTSKTFTLHRFNKHENNYFNTKLKQLNQLYAICKELKFSLNLNFLWLKSFYLLKNDVYYFYTVKYKPILVGMSN